MSLQARIKLDLRKEATKEAKELEEAIQLVLRAAEAVRVST
jgi:hypothetical protein